MSRAGWNPIKDNALRGLRAKNVPFREIAQILGHTAGAVKRRARYLGITKPVMPDWTDGEIGVLARMRAAREPFKVIAAELGRSVGACTIKAQKLGIYAPCKAAFAPESLVQQKARNEAETAPPQSEQPIIRDPWEGVVFPSIEPGDRGGMKPSRPATHVSARGVF